MGRILHYGFVLMVATVAATGLLAWLNFATKERIAEMDKKLEKEAREIALNDAEKYDESKVIIKSVGEGKNLVEYKFIPGFNKNGELTGYVVSSKTAGYGATGIKFVAGIGLDGKVKGIKITDAASETPGLGSKITEEKWQSHWKGIDKKYNFNKSIDGFAGATISPRGVYNGIINILNVFDKVKETDISSKESKPVDEINKQDKNLEDNAKKSGVIPGAEIFDSTKSVKIETSTYIPAYSKENKLLGYTVFCECQGYNGIVKFVFGIDMNGKITNIKIIDASSETPGLGYRVTEKEWQNRWIGRDKNYTFNKDVDGFAGATITPEAVYKEMNKMLIDFETIKNKEVKTNGEK